MKAKDQCSPFNWQGKPSIFTTGNWRSAQNFTGANSTRSANQSRLEPRPTYITSDSVYLRAATPMRPMK